MPPTTPVNPIPEYVVTTISCEHDARLCHEWLQPLVNLILRCIMDASHHQLTLPLAVSWLLLTTRETDASWVTTASHHQFNRCSAVSCMDLYNWSNADCAMTASYSLGIWLECQQLPVKLKPSYVLNASIHHLILCLSVLWLSATICKPYTQLCHDCHPPQGNLMPRCFWLLLTTSEANVSMCRDCLPPPVNLISVMTVASH